MNPEFLLTRNYLFHNSNSKIHPRKQGVSDLRLGCCLHCFALLVIFFGASASKQNSLANQFYITMGVPCFWKRGGLVTGHCPLGEAGIHLDELQSASLFFDTVNDATSGLFLAGRSQELFAMEGTWAALSRLSPPPIGLKSCGLCQNILLMWSRSEKCGYILLFS